MPDIDNLFPTLIYRAAPEADAARLNAELAAAALALAREDQAGRRWCRENGYRGYTSYASLDDLPHRASAFAELKRRLDRHASAFAGELAFDLGGRRLKLDSLWVNVMPEGGVHTGHIHPNSVLSGTYYVAMPKGASGLRFEDPRLPMMMAAPPVAEDADPARRRFVTIRAEPGTILLWESWLRHEVPPNAGRGRRISVSFNYAWR